MKIYRETIPANTEQTFLVDSQKISIYNKGEGNIFINFDKEATLETGLEIPAGMWRDNMYFPYRIQKLHVISDADATIQIDTIG